MKFKAMLLGLSVMTALPAFAQKPVYLDTGKPIEGRRTAAGSLPRL